MNEIKANEINVEYTLPSIKFDLTAIEKEVDEIVQLYKNLVVSEDDVDSAKKTSAMLNKSAKALSDKRIELTKKIKQPIDEFENSIKALTKRLETVSNDIKVQVDVFTEKEKESKRKAIMSHETWADYMYFDEKWLNKGTKLEEVWENLDAQKKQFQNSSLLITTTCNAIGLQPEKYLLYLAEKRDVNQIIAMIQNDNDVKKQYANAPTPSVETPQINIAESQDTTTISYDLRIYGTKTQLKALRGFIESNGMSYEKL